MTFAWNASKQTLVRRDLLERLSKLYFYGHRLDLAMQAELFARMSQWRAKTTGGGYCYETAALVMYALHGVENARICYGLSAKGYDHAWVEYKAFGTWWVVDMVWLSARYAVLPRRAYYDTEDPQVIKTVTYGEFWRGPNAYLYEILQNPGSIDQGYLFSLLSDFRPLAGYGLRLRRYVDRDGWRTFDDGRQTPYCMLSEYSSSVVQGLDINHMMLDPAYRPATWRKGMDMQRRRLIV